jgi:hypothetical protein
MDCKAQFEAVLAWEWNDPELLALHFITVASYNLQHPAQFTEQALTALKREYIDHLDRGKPVAEIRRRMTAALDGNARVLRDDAERRAALRPAGRTVAGVYLPDRPDGAAERVRAWASAVRRET